MNEPVGGIASALTGQGPQAAQNAAESGQTGQNTAGQKSEKKGSFLGVPSGMSQVGGWAVGLSLGESIADDWLAEDPGLQSALDKVGLDKDGFKELMQGMMCEVTKSLSDSTKYLKEMDDDEDKPAGILAYQ